MEADLNKVIEYWNTRPCNIRHSNSEVGTRQYFDEVEARKYLVEPHIPKFAEFEKWKNKKVLEIGCGIGTDAKKFAENGANYTGVEISKESLILARKRFELYKLPGRFIEGNAEEVDKLFNDETFDLIYSFGVLHHTPNIENALRAIHNLSNPNSIIKIMVYATNSWKNCMIQAGYDQPEAQSGCPIANTYSKDEFSRLLQKHGFKVVDIKQDHIFPYQVEKYINYEYEFEPWFKSMPLKMFRDLEKQLGWHMLINSVKL